MSSHNVSRRTVAAAAVGLALACGVSPDAQAAAPAHLHTQRIALLGDSITAGYGLPARDALPVRLQGELVRMGFSVQVIPEGVVGDTTRGGAARVARGAGADADLCVVALGGNDLLQGADPTAVRHNLETIVHRLKARGVTVVLAGIKVPPILQGRYAAQFDAAFAEVAREQHVLFLPDMLAGVVLNPELNQHDGVHPNAAGVEVIARRLAPVVAEGLVARAAA